MAFHKCISVVSILNATTSSCLQEFFTDNSLTAIEKQQMLQIKSQ